MAKSSKQAAGVADELTPICGIGASAGGVKALQQFFQSIDPNLGLAYVVIVHLAPDFPSHLSEILEALEPEDFGGVPHGDVAACVAAIRRIAGRPSRPDLGRYGIVAERFSQRRLIPQMVGAIESA